MHAQAAAYADLTGNATLVSAASPMPVRAVALPAATAALTGSSGTAAVVGPFTPDLGRPIWVTLSGTLIFMTGPMQPGTSGAGSIAVRDAKHKACAGRPNVFFIDNIAGQPWVFGTGKDGVTNGSGNSDVVTLSDGTHLTDYGHAYIAHRIAMRIS